MKVRELLNEGTEKLEAAGIDNAAYDARVILEDAYGLDAAGLLMNLNRDICPGALGGTEPSDIRECPGDCGAISTFNMGINMRLRHVPLQHIIGHTGFMGLDFKVSRDVLIPRQDTETLVETVLEREKDPAISILDLCTGSGCIAVSLKKLGGYSQVAASDLSDKAIGLAMRNASINDAEIRLIKSDLFKDIEGSFDVIVSNPPYIPTEEIETLSPEVRDHDPRLALDGGSDGLDIYRRIVSECGDVLNTGGRLYMEIGFDQAAAVGGLMEKAGFRDIEVVKDLAGKDRVIFGILTLK